MAWASASKTSNLHRFIIMFLTPTMRGINVSFFRSVLNSYRKKEENLRNRVYHSVPTGAVP